MSTMLAPSREATPPSQPSRPGPAAAPNAGLRPTDPGAAAAPARSAGWFANRPLAVKFGVLLTVVSLAFAGLVGAMLISNARVHAVTQEQANLVEAQALVLQLDTRASELKVDGFKAMVREDPSDQLPELADDIDTPTAMLTQLAEVPLEGASAAAVAEVQSTYVGYLDAISAVVDTAVADQEAARAEWEDIQAANDITDGAVGAAKDALDAATADAEVRLGAALDASARTGWIVAAIGIALIAAISVLTQRSITRPVGLVRRSLEAMAAGDLTVTADVTSTDEVGQMATALSTAQRSLRATLGEVAEASVTIAAASEEMSAAGSQVAAGSEETSVQAGVVAAAAEQVSRNVQAVAAGAEQMGASIREIAQNANEAAKVAGQAVVSAESTAVTVGELGESSKEIGNVVKAITSIAEQTNLLALNATIEAARAGEAGKGFAVVAGEVKELAQESARAAEDIAARIAVNQTQTASAVAAIGEISAIIAQINDFQLTIASAVEEQTATTNEMSRGVTEAATGSGEIAVNITGVATAAGTSTEVVTQMQPSVRELAEMSTDLRARVSGFTF